MKTNLRESKKKSEKLIRKSKYIAIVCDTIIHIFDKFLVKYYWKSYIVFQVSKPRKYV